VLAVAGQGEPSSQVALAQHLGVDRTVMTYLLDDLEAAKLVAPHPRRSLGRKKSDRLSTNLSKVPMSRGRPLLLAPLSRHAAELLPNAVDVPAVLPATTRTARRRQVGNDLARGDVALD
jgi:hypothetical protein